MFISFTYGAELEGVVVTVQACFHGNRMVASHRGWELLRVGAEEQILVRHESGRIPGVPWVGMQSLVESLPAPLMQSLGVPRILQDVADYAPIPQLCSFSSAGLCP